MISCLHAANYIKGWTCCQPCLDTYNRQSRRRAEVDAILSGADPAMIDNSIAVPGLPASAIDNILAGDDAILTDPVNGVFTPPEDEDDDAIEDEPDPWDTTDDEEDDAEEPFTGGLGDLDG